MPTKFQAIAASELRDTQGEILDVAGADISELEAGRGVVNDNHSNKLPDVVGRITYAKKILKVEDCENEDQKRLWNKVKAPYIFTTGILFDDEDHRSAKAAAAIIKHQHTFDSPLKLKCSVEGGILERGKSDDRILKRTKIKGLALTLTPANNATLVEGLNLTKSAISPQEQVLIKSVIPLAKDSVPTFIEIADTLSESKIQSNIKKIHAIVGELKKNKSVSLNNSSSNSKENTIDRYTHKLGPDLFVYTTPHFPKEHKKISDLTVSGVEPHTVNQHVNSYRFNENKNYSKALDNLDASADYKPNGQRAMSSLRSGLYYPHDLFTNDGQTHNETMGVVFHGEPSHSFVEDQGSSFTSKGQRFLPNSKPEGRIPKSNDEIYEAWLAPSNAKNIGYMRTSLQDNVDDFLSKDYVGKKMALEALKRGKRFFIQHRTDPSKQFEITNHHFKNDLVKTLSAGVGVGAPSTKTGGQVLQTEALDSSGSHRIECPGCGSDQHYMRHQVRCRSCGKSFPFDTLAKFFLRK